ncbi:hypothetical protein E2562_031810 [Oryza meyeriana var. granulata]|uniref:DUF4283 domain-containing protein n=1 Tax=Oryza meyeriana var. granulata TaxID=110450 RepID=A0A6G1EC06_9ORYZ|nr:hypothetical protein E2562_031810 [Oryza meyeriana var. granulata]
MEDIRVGELDLCPDRSHCLLSWTAGDLVEAIHNRAGIQDHNLRVEVTSTKDFLITFCHWRDRDVVFRCSHDLFYNDVSISFKPWSRRSWAISSELFFFTKISLDGLSMHLWELEVAHNLVSELGRELRGLIPVDDAHCLGLFAWFKNPSDLPQLIDVEVPKRPKAMGSWRERTSSAPPGAPRSKPTLVYRVIIHMEEVLDPTLLHTSDVFPEDDSDDDDTVPRNAFSC